MADPPAPAPETQTPPPPLFLTGATGHTGARLVRALIAQGRNIVALTRDPDRAARTLGIADADAPPSSIRLVRGDLDTLSAKALGKAMDGCDALVALSHVRFAPLLINACDVARLRRAIFLSSARKYTRFPDEPADQVRAGEDAIRNSGLDTTILRPTMIFGGPDDRNLEVLMNLTRRWPVLPLPGGGRNQVQPTFVLDLIAAIVATLDRPATIGREYDLGGPEPMTYRTMVRALAQAAGRPGLWLIPVPLGPIILLRRLYEKSLRRPRLVSDQLRRMGEDKTVDIALARRDLDYHPTPFQEAVTRKAAGQV